MTTSWKAFYWLSVVHSHKTLLKTHLEGRQNALPSVPKFQLIVGNARMQSIRIELHFTVDLCRRDFFRWTIVSMQPFIDGYILALLLFLIVINYLLDIFEAWFRLLSASSRQSKLVPCVREKKILLDAA